LASLKQFDQGMALLNQVFDQVPEDELAQIAMLRMLIDSKNFKEAIQKSREWLKNRPGDNDLRALLGIALFRDKKFRLASEFLAKSLEDELPRQFVNETIALLALSKNDVDKAIAFYQKELHHFPRIKHNISLGNLYVRNKNWDNAIKHYSIALTKKEGVGPDLRKNLSQSYFNLKDYKHAEEVLEPALKNFPENPDYLLLQANIFAATGRKAEGEKLFKKAVENKKKAK